MKIILMRHGQSKWNLSNQFTGWTDVELTEVGEDEALKGALELKKINYDFDICYTSYLKRAISTLNIVLKTLDREWLPVIKNWKLNERHYGALQGLNKEKTAKKYGEEKVHLWRRSYAIRPPELDISDPRNPTLADQYRGVPKNVLPLCESLEDTYKRVIPFFESEIKNKMLNGKQVLIVAHGNSLRALVKYFENLSEEEILKINIPTGVPLEYEFDDNFNFISKKYLGDEKLVNEEINKVINQGKAE